MPHIDDARDIYAKGSGSGMAIGLLFAIMYFIVNIVLVVFAVLAVLSYNSDVKLQQNMMFSVIRNEA